MDETKYPCTKCGANLRIASKFTDQTLIHTAVCPSCTATYSTIELLEIQSEIDMGKVPIVTTLKAARMLGKPGQPNWVMENFRGEIVGDENGHFVTLSGVRAYADVKNIAVEPTDTILWWNPLIR